LAESAFDRTAFAASLANATRETPGSAAAPLAARPEIRQAGGPCWAAAGRMRAAATAAIPAHVAARTRSMLRFLRGIRVLVTAKVARLFLNQTAAGYTV